MTDFPVPAAADRVLSPSGLCLQFLCQHDLDEQTGMCILDPRSPPCTPHTMARPR